MLLLKFIRKKILIEECNYSDEGILYLKITCNAVKMTLEFII